MRYSMPEISEAAERLTPTASNLADPRGGLDAKSVTALIASNADIVRITEAGFKP